MLAAVILTLFGTVSGAQEFIALASIEPDASIISDSKDGMEIRLNLTRAVPYRIYTLDAPPRVVIDFNEVDFSAMPKTGFNQSIRILDFRYGPIMPGWSRLVLELDAYFRVETAALNLKNDGRATVFVQLEATDALSFAQDSGAPSESQYLPNPNASAQVLSGKRQTGDGPITVVLDPGHGGIDPGAERGDVVEAALMLTFARELQELLLRTGNFKVVLTRDSDYFVPLEARVSIAREARADVFISLHADALVEGRASGSTIYTLSENASDIASQKLAERHDRSDLLAGVDLSNQDDVIAGVLMDLARVETSSRSEKLADALVSGLSSTVGMHKRPKLSAGFSVLKAPDIPSVLLELGFLSSKRDRERLNDAEWRQQAAIGIHTALSNWAVTDAVDGLLLRK